MQPKQKASRQRSHAEMGSTEMETEPLDPARVYPAKRSQRPRLFFSTWIAWSTPWREASSKAFP